MANTHSKPEPGTTQAHAIHHYTVGYRPNRGQPNPLPQLTIKGRWLERAGFTTGTPIMITVVNGHLVITPLPRQSLLNNIMPKIEHLSPASQRQLMQIINGLMVQEQQGK